jgi:hypothetical protein
MIFGKIFIGTFLFAKLNCLSSDKVRFAHPPEAENDGHEVKLYRYDGIVEYWASELRLIEKYHDSYRKSKH